MIIDPGNAGFQRDYDVAWEKTENAMRAAARRLTRPELVEALSEVDELGKSMSTVAVSVTGMAGLSPEMALSIFSDTYEPVRRQRAEILDGLVRCV